MVQNFDPVDCCFVFGCLWGTKGSKMAVFVGGF